MTKYHTTIALICNKKADVDAANAWLQRQGYGPNNISEEWSATGQKAATAWAVTLSANDDSLATFLKLPSLFPSIDVRHEPRGQSKSRKLLEDLAVEKSVKKIPPDPN
jgi:hypothetical protein